MPDNDLTASHTSPDSPNATSFTVIQIGAPGAVGGTLPVIPGYELHSQIGSGGMGVVYSARDTALNRSVAVKFLRASFPTDAPVVQRFLDEAQISGQLQHPGIPPVHQVGALPDGRPYMVMKLIKGRTLQTSLAERTDRAADRGQFVAVFEQICLAVGYAHSHGVVHRDLKPTNIMVGAFGEVQVMDWGLAKVVGATVTRGESSMPGTVIRSVRNLATETQAGSVLGSPAFMPPEQAGGEVTKIDPRTDVFGLGAVLCVILTGAPPYTGDNSNELQLKAVRGQTEDALARLDACGAEPELVALCKQCLATNPSERPVDGGAVGAVVAAFRTDAERRARQAELDRVRAEGELAAARATAVEQRKRRQVQLVLLAAVALLVSSAAVAARLYQREQDVRAKAKSDLQLATARQVDAELQSAKALNELGWTQAMELEQWAVTMRQAFLAQDRAELLLADGEATDELRERVREGRRLLNEADADRRLGLGIEDCLGSILELEGRSESYSEASLRLERLLRERGLDMTTEPGRARTVEWARAHPLRVSIQTLMTFLSFWYPNNEMKLHFVKVAQAIDPDRDALYRQWLRAVLVSDAAALTRLSADPVVTELAPTALALMGVALMTHGDQEAALLRLKEWHARYPDDFWLNVQLAKYLTASQLSRGQQALRYATAAVALRKQSPRAHHTLAHACYWNRNFSEADAACRKALELNPDYLPARVMTGLLLASNNDLDGAESVFRKVLEVDPKFVSARNHLDWVLKRKAKTAPPPREVKKP